MGDNIYKQPVGEPTTESMKTGLKENEAKEKRTEELIIANKELAFQKEENEKQIAELMIAIKQAEAENAALKSISKYNRNLIEVSPNALVTIAPDGIVTDVNAAMENATGLHREKLIGTEFSAYFTQPGKAKAGYQQAFREGMVFDYELELKNINGHTTPVLYNASVYKDDAGKTIGIFATARDITATRKAENELLYLKNNLELLVKKRVAELVIANKEIAYEKEEKKQRAAELAIADKELAFEVGEKADRAAELVIADKELAFEVGEKADRAAELVIADKELAFEVREKADRAAELVIADKELAFEVREKADRAAELVIANKELAFQNEEKEKRVTELIIANKELAFQNEEKEKRAAELVIANKELAFQNEEKEKRAAELIIANKELAFQNEEKGKILHLSFHDQLTGIYNRRFYVEELKRLDTKRNLPLSLIMGDVNGLKLINDSFGHAVGDVLIKKAAEVMKKGCRSDDILARHGGDEFVIILPKTNGRETEEIIKRIKTLSSKEKVGGSDISIAFGYATKEKEKENIQEIFKKAEEHMYRNKLCESPSLRGKTIELIMITLYEKSKREHLHSIRVSEICELIAAKMNFDKDAVIQIRTAGLMHDIGKIGIKDEILNNPRELTPDEWNEIKKHPEIGYRILSSANEFSEIADQILQHHEQWNGEGYPKGLKDEEILLPARIISIAEAFDAMTSDWMFRNALSEEEAINEIKRCSGTKFDPTISRIFIEEVLGKDWVK
ncbi:diguanylate cyclase [Acetobacterium sp.]|uniref:diguanylate cyclase n=1 Tax=Acetobacterium sp. TaxID=1872094 RepID=UPI002F428EE0